VVCVVMGYDVKHWGVAGTRACVSVTGVAFAVIGCGVEQ